jgi:hypothetical protein
VEKTEGEKDQKKPIEPLEDEDKISDEELEVPELKALPTFLKITNKKDPIPVEKGGSALVRLETDVVDSYLENENSLRFRCINQTKTFKDKSQSKLRNGKISHFIFCPSSTRIGSRGHIKFELDLPDTSPLKVERDLVCVEPQKKQKSKQEIRLPEPNIKPISQKDRLYNERGYDVNSVGEIFLETKEPAILVSIENMHLQNSLKKLNEAIIESTKDRYVAAIAYYLLLKEVDKKKNAVKHQIIDDEKENDIDIDLKASPELQRLAKTASVLVLPIENI